jgi:hypothetical protein
MTVVSSKEFAANQQKYFDMALDGQVFVKRGDNMFHILCANMDAVNNNKQTILEPDDDLRRAITAEELKKRMHLVIDKFFNQRDERNIHLYEG